MRHVSILFLALVLIGCKEKNKFEYDIIVTETATNLRELNSEFDDFNSDLPYPHQLSDIYFSSNRNSRGTEFDIIGGELQFSYHKEDNVLNLRTSVSPPRESKLLFPKINTSFDELGPHSYVYANYIYDNYARMDILFFYANNSDDNFKIKFVEYTNWLYSNNQVSDPITLGQINEKGDNLYPSIGEDRTKLYFCSNRDDSHFSIYSATYSSEITKQSLIDDNIIEFKKEEIVNSNYDDKCPYIYGNFMVFASNRDGNFDIWYSKFENNQWSNPMKFGEEINSTISNEYRPVIFNVLGYNLMVFSSDRPGGKGGYDLYIVKIDKYIK
jgi:hypothetical protein